jgi:hypothetical protein
MLVVLSGGCVLRFDRFLGVVRSYCRADLIRSISAGDRGIACASARMAFSGRRSAV